MTTIVAIHGVGLDASMWSLVAVDLAPSYEFVTYDLLGHGARRDVIADLPAFVAQLSDVIGDRRVALVGFSLGALIAQAFASEHGALVERLVLVNSVYRRSPDERAAVLARVRSVRDGGYGANVEEAMRRWFSAEFHTAHPDRVDAVRAVLDANDPVSYAAAYEVFATADAAVDVSRLPMPVLAATGELDPRSTPAMALAIAEAAPFGEVVIWSGVRHMSPIEAPCVVAASISAFLVD